jgi:hypothetical protein
LGHRILFLAIVKTKETDIEDLKGNTVSKAYRVLV